MDADETLERKALQNTRALVDKLESQERSHGKRQKRALVIFAIVALIPVAVAVIWSADSPKESLADKQARDCKMEAWSAKASERTDQIRAANPGMAYGEIAKKLKKEQDTFMETAKVACEGAPDKAGK